jgi:hypothetical protein
LWRRQSANADLFGPFEPIMESARIASAHHTACGGRKIGSRLCHPQEVHNVLRSPARRPEAALPFGWGFQATRPSEETGHADLLSDLVAPVDVGNRA